MARISPRFSRGDRTETTTESSTDDEDDQPIETSIEDLTSEADVEEFDRTFQVNVDDEPFAVGDSPAIPRPWEGIPRVAITYNLNFVWDDEEGRWRRDTGNSGGILREILDSGSSVTQDPVDVDFGGNLSTTFSSGDPGEVTVQASSSATLSEPAAKARLTSSQTVSSNSVTAVELDSTTYDRNGDFDTNNFQFFPPSDGIYQVGFVVTVDPTADGTFLQARIDYGGVAVTAVEGVAASGSRGFSVSGSTDVSVTTGSAFVLRVFTADGGSITLEPGDAQTYMYCRKVGSPP